MAYSTRNTRGRIAASYNNPVASGVKATGAGDTNGVTATFVLVEIPILNAHH